MKHLDEFCGSRSGGELLRWGLIAFAAALAALLAGSLETGRLHAQSGTAFSFTTALVRVITPNSDGINDVAILCVDNPQSNAVRGEVFDLRGRKVAEMSHVERAGVLQTNSRSCPLPGGLNKAEALTWDGKAGGGAVRSGVYIYLIKAEDKAVTGTVLVVR